MTTHRFAPSIAMLLVASLAGCAHQPRIAATPPVPVVAAAPLPEAPALPPGVSPTMVVPAVLADGRYPTPNQGLTPAATLWHFRVALNVAALACRGAEGDAIVAGYNAMLTRRKAVLAAAETRYSAEWQAAGGDWRDRYDDAMTRLYNYFSMAPARTGFCAAAVQALGEVASLPDDALPGFASTELPAFDRPFTDVYRAFDAWRAGRMQGQPRTVIALAAVPATVPQGGAAPTFHPRLELDPSVFQDR